MRKILPSSPEPTPIDESPPPTAATLGVCQWFHFEAYHDVERAAALLEELGIRHLRTGISWADYHRPGGPAWYDWQMKALSRFELLVSVWHTPPSLAEAPRCAAPPRRLRDYADFIDTVIQRHGGTFGDLELWNEPNNLYKWDFAGFDPQWRKFGQMVRDAAHWAKCCGKRTVLGGMMPVDRYWLALMHDYGVMPFIDVVAMHGFPGMWWPGGANWEWYDTWAGWSPKVRSIAPQTQHRPVWITETGLATWDLDAQRRDKHELQVRMLERAAAAPVERVYWYALLDLDPRRQAIEGFHVDENEYHMGLVAWDGEKKPAFFRMKELLAERRASRGGHDHAA